MSDSEDNEGLEDAPSDEELDSSAPSLSLLADGAKHLRKLCLVTGILGILASGLVGGISDSVWGCENTTIVASQSPEGEIYTQHGCPTEVIPIGDPAAPQWDGYVVVYRMEEHHQLLGTLMQEDRSSNIAYLIQSGRVSNGGYVGYGSGSTFLRSLDGARPGLGLGVGGEK
jgi:hypothetical protein